MLSSKTNNLPIGKKRGILNWIIQLLLWILLISYIISKKIEYFKNKISTKSILNYILIICLTVNYIIYIISNILFSKIFLFLLIKKKSKKLKETLQKNIKKLPKIIISINCYHIENNNNENDTKINNSEESNYINTTNETIQTKITTYNENKEFKYYSCRDISGEINLDNDIFKQENFIFVDLNLDYEIIFGDTITMYDYDTFKNNILTENKWRDVHLDCEEKKIINLDFENKIIQIDNTNSNYINWQLYLIILIIGLIEFYKLYIEKFIVIKNYIIRKVISSRNIINKDDFKYLEPKIVFHGESFYINENNETYINNDYKPKNITKSEIKESKKYESLLDKMLKFDLNDANLIIDEDTEKDNSNNLSNNNEIINNINMNNEKENILNENNEVNSSLINEN